MKRKRGAEWKKRKRSLPFKRNLVGEERRTKSAAGATEYLLRVRRGGKYEERITGGEDSSEETGSSNGWNGAHFAGAGLLPTRAEESIQGGMGRWKKKGRNPDIAFSVRRHRDSGKNPSLQGSR